MKDGLNSIQKTNGLVESTRRLLTGGNVNSEDIMVLSISRHSLGGVPVDESGKLLREKTPIWSDKRAIKEADSFLNKIDYNDWYLMTGNGFPPTCYSLFKILWYRNNEPDMFKRIHRVIGTKDYCNFKLTGRICTDYSYAF